MSKKPMLAWGGFVDGKLLNWTVDDDFGGVEAFSVIDMPSVFKSKKAARDRFRDVRRVEIREVKKP